jgi:hypothetical protein
MKRKFQFIFFISTLMLLLLSTTCFAYSTSYSFNTGSGGRAYLSGRDNGIFYSFTKGKTAQLDLSHTKGTGTLYITLYKNNSWIGNGTSMGSKTWSVEPPCYETFYWDIDETRDDYYLFFQGSGSYVQYQGSGTFTEK